MMELRKTQTWLRGRTNMPENEKFEPPPIATIPEPPPAMTDGDAEKKKILGQAAEIYDNLKSEIHRLRVERDELILLLESEKRKTAALEADLAESNNNAQISGAQNQGYKNTFQEFRRNLEAALRELDQHGITPPEKNGKRNGNGNKRKS